MSLLLLCTCDGVMRAAGGSFQAFQGCETQTNPKSRLEALWGPPGSSAPHSARNVAAQRGKAPRASEAVWYWGSKRLQAAAGRD